MHSRASVSHRPLRGVMALLATLAIVMTGFVAAPANAATSANASWCPKFRVFLAKGSHGVDLTWVGILPAKYSAKDATMQTFWDTFSRKVPGSDHVWVSYRAAPVVTGDIVGYEKSVTSGVNTMHAAVQGFVKACPETPWGMGGYSQGADLVGQYGKFIGRNPSLWRDTPNLLRNLKFAVVLANPSRNSAVPEIERLKPAPTHDGLIRKAYEMIFLGGRVQERLMTPKGDHLRITGSFCIQHDPVCDYEGFARAAVRVSALRIPIGRQAVGDVGSAVRPGSLISLRLSTAGRQLDYQSVGASQPN